MPIATDNEGLRARKQRQTRARIAEVAMRLFYERGFNAVTVEEIADLAGISKPTFFNYFSAKDDVVLAWQDRFSDALCEAILASPASVSISSAVATAMTDTLAASGTPEAFAIDQLIRDTPALAARNQAKYSVLEAKLAAAVMERMPTADPFEIRLLAMLTVGSLRMGTEAWRADDALAPSELGRFSREFHGRFWSAVARLSLARTAADAGD